MQNEKSNLPKFSKVYALMHRKKAKYKFGTFMYTFSRKLCFTS